MEDWRVIICRRHAANVLQTTLVVCGHTVSNVVAMSMPMEKTVYCVRNAERCYLNVPRATLRELKLQVSYLSEVL